MEVISYSLKINFWGKIRKKDWLQAFFYYSLRSYRMFDEWLGVAIENNLLPSELKFFNTQKTLSNSHWNFNETGKEASSAELFHFRYWNSKEVLFNCKKLRRVRLNNCFFVSYKVPDTTQLMESIALSFISETSEVGIRGLAFVRLIILIIISPFFQEQWKQSSAWWMNTGFSRKMKNPTNFH